MCIVLAASVLAVACANTPAGSPAQAQADAAIASRVSAALNDDPIFFFRHVEVSIDHGVASLTGIVWTTDALYRAQQITRGVPGVTRVVNRMELERPQRTGGSG
jgi:osmotically-inducible protein OsmY